VVAAVELPRDPAVLRAVPLDVGVEQVERDAPDLRLPRAQVERRAREADLDLDRLAVRPDDELERMVARIVRRLGADLVARGGHPLLDVTAAIEESDRDERQ